MNNIFFTENAEESTADMDEDINSEKDENQKSRDNRVEEYLNPEKRRGPGLVVDAVPSGPAASAFNLGDDEYWNEFLNGARKSVLDKLVNYLNICNGVLHILTLQLSLLL